MMKKITRVVFGVIAGALLAFALQLIFVTAISEEWRVLFGIMSAVFVMAGIGIMVYAYKG